MARSSTTYKTGQSGNPRGKIKGTKNRSTEQIRDFIKQVVDNNLEHLEQDLMAMNATNRWVILDKLTKYFLPSLSKNDNNNMNSGEVTIKVEYVDAQNKTDEEKDYG